MARDRAIQVFLQFFSSHGAVLVFGKLSQIIEPDFMTPWELYTRHALNLFSKLSAFVNNKVPLLETIFHDANPPGVHPNKQDRTIPLIRPRIHTVPHWKFVNLPGQFFEKGHFIQHRPNPPFPKAAQVYKVN